MIDKQPFRDISCKENALETIINGYPHQSNSLHVIDKQQNSVSIGYIREFKLPSKSFKVEYIRLGEPEEGTLSLEDNLKALESWKKGRHILRFNLGKIYCDYDTVQNKRSTFNNPYIEIIFEHENSGFEETPLKQQKQVIQVETGDFPEACKNAGPYEHGLRTMRKGLAITEALTQKVQEYAIKKNYSLLATKKLFADVLTFVNEFDMRKYKPKD